jgi:uncharacterized protein (TIGR02147 family)
MVPYKFILIRIYRPIFLHRDGRSAMEIFDYLDYRAFLKAFYKNRKLQNHNFSHRFIAARAGFNASTFTKVLQGKRNLSIKLAYKLAKILKLGRKESDYFNLLVLFNQAVKHEDKKQFLEQLLSYRPLRAKTLLPGQYEYFSKWYYAVIRELLHCCRFGGGYAGLAQMLRPAIEPKEAKEAILFMEKAGLIKKNADGFFEPTDLYVSTGEEWRSVAINNYQLSVIKLAAEAINLFPREEIDFSTLILRLSKTAMETARKKIKQLRKELMDLENQDREAADVYQASFNLFPVAKTTGEEQL